MPSPKWIKVNQQKEVLARHPGRLVWVNQCLRCGAEQAICEGPVEDALSQSRDFILKHRECAEKPK
jgi:hypothetical protein